MTIFSYFGGIYHKNVHFYPKSAFRTKWHAMASTWVEKQHIFIKYKPKALKKGGANLERRILCLQKNAANNAKTAFLEVFANFAIFEAKKISLWVLQWSKSARIGWPKYYRSHFYQKIDFHNFSPNPPPKGPLWGPPLRYFRKFGILLTNFEKCCNGPPLCYFQKFVIINF